MDMPVTVNTLRNSQRIILEAVVGSHAYGTATAASDVDICGVFVLPLSERLILEDPIEEVSDEKQNVKFFELSKFFKMLAQCNPNSIELLWTPEDCLRFIGPSGKRLLENRKKFISRLARDRFVGYALSQIQKARGQNKMVWHPQPTQPPRKDEFCWVIRLQGAALPQISSSGVPPCRPIPLQESGICLQHFHAAALEHTPQVYRLYEYGTQAKGVFRNDMLVCEPIPLADEYSRFWGLLIYNDMEWERAHKDWRRYWEWMEHRNPARWVTQESGELDYDAKNMMHCVRLLISGAHLLRTGEPLVRFAGQELQLLLDIRTGRFQYQEIMEIVDKRMKMLEACLQDSNLPPAPDQRLLNLLFQEIATSLP